MFPGQTFRRRIGPLVALVLGVGLYAVNVWAQEVAPRPYSRESIVGLLKGEVSPKRVAALARQRGIDFQITPEVESELRRAGANAELLATLREVAPAPPKPPERPKPAAGTVRENPKDRLKYVWIPPGTFMMGCSPGDSECGVEEKPAHQVTITRGFWIGQTPVTVGAYKRFAEAPGRQMPDAPTFNSGWVNDSMPIVNVTWDDATAYCGWAGGRLPTEAEWEYAARAGSAEARYGPIDEVAWYANNSNQMTHEVGQKRPNAWNLHDTLGNVWQWVNDWYDQNYYQSSPSQDPIGAASGQSRVLRGGSWYFVRRLARVSYRYQVYPSSGLDYFGFRCGGEMFAP